MAQGNGLKLRLDVRQRRTGLLSTPHSPGDTTCTPSPASRLQGIQLASMYSESSAGKMGTRSCMPSDRMKVHSPRLPSSPYVIVNLRFRGHYANLQCSCIKLEDFDSYGARRLAGMMMKTLSTRSQQD
ncbi:hypothetical protein AC579_4812 [Pseudocercospora musae]|uniref:Uncharacterized protein n=1 Tax=Pseudocercospora musae TaxID=113226 RepID=A0A139IIB2_9PEZI|nr:hypothetical protein AC579_4812 [Pseudocercospora musae]